MACNDCNDENITDIPVGPVGPQGVQGIQGDPGINSFGITTGIATALGGGSYSIPMTGTNNNQWVVVGQIVYIANTGYYLVTTVTAGVSIVVLDTTYTGNVPSYMLSNTPLRISPGGLMGPQGLTGATGATGPTGPTGPAGTIGNGKRIPSQSITASHNVTINPAITNTTGAVAPVSFSGFIYLTATAAVDVTVTVYNDGVIINDSTAISTMPAIVTGGTTKLAIPIFGTASLNPTKSITVKVDLNSYAGTVSIANGYLIVIGNL